MKKSIAFIFFTALLCVQCDFYQNLPKVDYDSKIKNSSSNNKEYQVPSSNRPPGAEPGKCYSTDMYYLEEIELAIYTGNEAEKDVELEIREIEIESGVIETYKIVVDTTQTENYDILKVDAKKLARKGGLTVVWVEVLCPQDITSSVVRQVQDALQFRGYGDDRNILDNKIIVGLKAFQRDHGLPVGNLDFQTLYALNIKY